MPKWPLAIALPRPFPNPTLCNPVLSERTSGHLWPVLEIQFKTNQIAAKTVAQGSKVKKNLQMHW